MSALQPTSRLVYDDSATIGDLQSDALRCGVRLRRLTAARTPSIRYEDHPREVAKPEITISAAAQRIANALSLHLD